MKSTGHDGKVDGAAQQFFTAVEIDRGVLLALLCINKTAANLSRVRTNKATRKAVYVAAAVSAIRRLKSGRHTEPKVE